MHKYRKVARWLVYPTKDTTAAIIFHSTKVYWISTGWQTLLGARGTVVCQGYICGASENHKALTGKTTLEYLAAENSASCINIQVSWQALSYAIYEKKPERCLFPRNLASLLELLRMLQFPPPLQEAIYVPWRTRLEGHLAGCCQQRWEQMGDKEVRENQEPSELVFIWFVSTTYWIPELQPNPEQLCWSGFIAKWPQRSMDIWLVLRYLSSSPRLRRAVVFLISHHSLKGRMLRKTVTTGLLAGPAAKSVYDGCAKAIPLLILRGPSLPY